MTAVVTSLTTIGLLAGCVAGGAYFWLLHRTVRLQVAGAPVRILLPLHVVRGGLAIAVFWGLAQAGAWPLIAGLGGFLAARLIVQRLVAGT